MRSRVASLLALPLLALALVSSLTPACDSGGGVSCQNPTTAQQVCITCINSSCANDVSALDSECPTALSCEESCNCGDTTCSSACLKSAGDAGTACLGAGVGFVDCINTMCKPQCSGTSF